jgi:hypothetical protein
MIHLIGLRPTDFDPPGALIGAVLVGAAALVGLGLERIGRYLWGRLRGLVCDRTATQKADEEPGRVA